MKQTLRMVIGASASSFLALSVLAQDPTEPKTNALAFSSHDRMAHGQHWDRLNGATKASDLIGITVKNLQDEKLGKVDELGVDLESGRVVEVILSSGGFIGMGERLTAVPPGAFHRDLTNEILVLDANKEKMKSAPAFEMSKWADNSDSNHLAEMYGYYGQMPGFTFVQGQDAVQDGQRNMDSDSKADGAWSRDRMGGQGQYMIPASRLGQIQRASKLMGMAVKNLQDEKLGKVENFLVDLASGRIVAVVVSSGGFLGMDNELSAIPPTAFRFTADREALRVDTSKEMLSNAPHFNANHWPDFAQPDYASGVYGAYKVQPYFNTNMNAEPDNTARNVQDRDSRAVTPMDQGNNQADINTTAQIRKDILAGKDMSMNAKNVKIITMNGQVTLRGPVNSDDEKRQIGDIATRIAASGNVDNQLEVKPGPGGGN